MKTILHIAGMHCPACKKLISMNIADLPGITSCAINPDTGEATIVYDEQQTSLPDIQAAIVASGDYTVT